MYERVWPLPILLLTVGLIFCGCSAPQQDDTIQAVQTVAQPLEPAVPEGMVKIPGGTVDIGCLPDEQGCTAGPLRTREQTVNDFFLDRDEISQWQLQEAIGTNPSKNPEDGSRGVAGIHGEWGGDPVNSVTQAEAEDYCQRLGKRLPTRAEWTLAMQRRANVGSGNTEQDGRCYMFDSMASSRERADLRQKHIVIIDEVQRSCTTQFERCFDPVNAQAWETFINNRPQVPADALIKVFSGTQYCAPLFGPDERSEALSFRCAADIGDRP